MHKGFFLDVLQRRPALFAAIMAFNSSKLHVRQRASFDAAYQHAYQILSQLPDVDAKLLSSLPTVQHRLSALPVPEQETKADESAKVSMSNAPHQEPYWDFIEESRRLLFLSPQELQALAKTFGVALHAASYAHRIQRDDVLALRSALGEELYAYGLARGRYQIGNIRTIFVTEHNTKISTADILEGVNRDGWRALSICSSTWPQELKQYLALHTDNQTDATAMYDANTVRGVWFTVKKLLLREVAPQWAACFD